MVKDRIGNEVKQGDFVILATKCTDDAEMRVGWVKNTYDAVAHIKTVCTSRWGSGIGMGDVYRSSYLGEGIDVIKINDPKSFMTEPQIKFATKKGWL